MVDQEKQMPMSDRPEWPSRQPLTRRRQMVAGVTLFEMLIVSALMAFALLGTLKAVTMTRNVTDRGEILTRLMLRAHAEIEARKAAAFDALEVGTTTLGDFEDPRTTGVLTIARLPDSPGLKVSVNLVTRTPNGVHTIELSARRFPEAGR